MLLLDFLLEGGLVLVLPALLLLDGAAGSGTEPGTGLHGERRSGYQALEIRRAARAAHWWVPFAHECFELTAARAAAKVIQRHRRVP